MKSLSLITVPILLASMVISGCDHAHTLEQTKSEADSTPHLFYEHNRKYSGKHQQLFWDLPPSFIDNKNTHFLGVTSSDSSDSYSRRNIADPPLSEAEKIYISAAPAAGTAGCPLGDLDGDCRSDIEPIIVTLLDDRGKPAPDQPFHIRIVASEGRLIIGGELYESLDTRSGPDGTLKLDLLLGKSIRCGGCINSRLFRHEEDEHHSIVGVHTILASTRNRRTNDRYTAELTPIAFPGAPARLVVPR